MDETMETGFEAEIDSAWNDEGNDVTEPAPEASTADQPELEARQEPTTPAKEEPATADQPELFTIKNRDETRQVTREELVAMAQKGWDYDKVREERDQLRQYRSETDPAMELIRRYAQRSNMSVSDYLDYCRKQELMASGMTEKDAAQKVSFDKERAELDRQKQQLDAERQQADSMRRKAAEQAGFRGAVMKACAACYEKSESMK